MNAPRTRSRAPVSTTPQQSTASENDGFGSYGMAGLDAAKKEAERMAAQREMKGSFKANRRFFMKRGTPGRKIIILDETLDHAFFMHEHDIFNRAAKERSYVTCRQHKGVCPICRAAEQGGKDSMFKQAYHAMYLTVLDYTPYVIQTGDRAGETIPQTKSLLVIKNSKIQEIATVLQTAQRMNGGRLRGVELFMVRGSDEKSPVHGAPTVSADPEFEGRPFSLWQEADLLSNFGGPAVIKDGKTVKPVNDDITAFKYSGEGGLFKMPTAASVASAWGLPPVDGSAAANERQWNNAPDTGYEPEKHVARPGESEEDEGFDNSQPQTQQQQTGGSRRRAPVNTQAGASPVQQGNVQGSSGSAGRTRRAAPPQPLEDDDGIPFN